MDVLHEHTGFDEAMLHQYYSYFKQKPIKRVVDAVLNVLQVQPHPHLAANSQASSMICSILQDDWETMDQYRVHLAHDDVTWDKYLAECLRLGLDRTSHAQLLHVCILTLNIRETKTLFSFVQKTSESHRNRLADLYLAPIRVIAQHIAQRWDMPSLITAPTLTFDSTARLPSKRKSNTTQVLSNEVEQTFDLHWQRFVLEYRGDLQIYVWQPHLRIEPEAYRSTTVIIPAEKLNPKTRSRMLILPHPPELRTALLNKHHVICPSTDVAHSWDARHEVFRVMMIIFECLREDSIRFVQDLTLKIQEMTLRGRRLPTRSKIQYLLHLDDCRRRAITDFRDNEAILEKFRVFVRSDDFCCQESDGRDDAVDLITDILEDLQYLSSTCYNIGPVVKSAREDIMEQMNLAQGQRALILTIAAALFVPMSFVASVFGMNVKHPLFPPPHKNGNPKSSDPTSSTTQKSPNLSTKDSTNGTQDVDQHYWTMRSYFEVAFPLTAGMILLPLLIGPLVRSSVQRYAHYRPYWRVTTSMTVVLLFVATWVSWGFHAYYLPILKRELDNAAHGHYTIYYKYLLRNSICYYTYLALNYGIFGTFFTFRIIWAFKQKKGRWRWTLLWLVVLTSMALDIFGWYTEIVGDSRPWGVMPYGCIMIYWGFSKKSTLRAFFYRVWHTRLGKKDEETLPLNDMSPL